MYTENDGTFEWMIDGDVHPGDYAIKINTVDETEEDFSNVFSISLPQTTSIASAINKIGLKGRLGFINNFCGRKRGTVQGKKEVFYPKGILDDLAGKKVKIQGNFTSWGGAFKRSNNVV